jgi:hypothetical protein
VRRAAQHQPGKIAMPPGANDDNPGAEIPGLPDDFPGGVPEGRIPCLPARLDPVLGQRPNRPLGRRARLVSCLVVQHSAPPAQDFPFPQVLRDLLGHSSVLTTQVYLSRIDLNRVFREAYEDVGRRTGLSRAVLAEVDDELADDEPLEAR